MKLRTTYDERADAAYIYINEAAKVVKTVEVGEDIIIDLDSNKKIVGIELLNAKKRLRLPQLSKEAN
ncbi:MAG: DUF2283 domain-containing protein [Nanoarchaeota archaeon]|nr:DUF2283 domain-containing protein [Nanoarchaeota archaeon]